MTRFWWGSLALSVLMLLQSAQAGAVVCTSQPSDQAPAEIDSIFDLTGRELVAVEQAAKALMSGRDLDGLLSFPRRTKIPLP